jgi:flavorubredoxin
MAGGRHAMMHDPSLAPPNPLPREIAPGVFWLSECMVVPTQTEVVHVYNGAYMVVGDRHAALIETGITSVHKIVLRQVKSLLEGSPASLRYVFVTHSEMAHCGGVGNALAGYPEATVHGEVSDLHLVFPAFADRIHFADPGDRFDLGGREIVVVESVFRDMAHSRWYFDTREKVLFPGDGFAYGHHHNPADCGRFAEEASGLDIAEEMGRFALAAFHWTHFVDIEPYLDRLDQLLFRELGVETVAPTHGLVISDPEGTMPTIKEGFRAMRTYSFPPELAGGA